MTLAAVALGWSAVLAAVAAWAAVRTRPAARQVRAWRGPVLLLRPCAGDEAHLARGLASSRAVGQRGRVRFLVAESADAAVPTVVRVSAALNAEGVEASIQITGARGPNRKAAQLACALETDVGEAGVVLVADSDVDLSTDLVAALLGPIDAGEADATWAPPVETCPATAADRASASILDASLHAFPLLAGIDGDGMVGKLFAVRSEALAATGGFGPLVDRLGEDVELARRLRRARFRVRVCGAVAPSLASGRSWAAVLGRYARWIGVVRSQRPALLVSYPLLLAATPLVVLAALAAIAREGLAGVAALGAALAVRWATALVARRRAGRPLSGALGGGMVADAVLLVAFLRAIATRELEWRGVRLALGRDGRLGHAERIEGVERAR
jgi:ceramide glucosyltransferase